MIMPNALDKLEACPHWFALGKLEALSPLVYPGQAGSLSPLVGLDCLME